MTQPKCQSYQSFEEVTKRVAKLKLPSWQQNVVDDQMALEQFEGSPMIPEFKLIIDIELRYTLIIFGWLLPEDHTIYKEYERSLQNITVSELIKRITQFKLCEGVTEPSNDLNFHAIPYHVTSQDDLQLPAKSIIYNRPKNCLVLQESEAQCQICFQREKKLAKDFKRKSKNLYNPAKPKAPVSATHPNRLKLTLQQQQLKCTQLQKEIEELRLAINYSGISVDPQLDKDVKFIMSREHSRISPFMKLFWDQQQKLSTAITMLFATILWSYASVCHWQQNHLLPMMN